MPVTQNYWITHQWLREMRRFTQSQILGVYFTVPDEERILAGHYSEQPHSVLASNAQNALRLRPEGFQVIIPHSIANNQISRIKNLPQVTGWKFHPAAKGERICFCPACIVSNSTGSTRIKKQRIKDIARSIANEDNATTIGELNDQLLTLLLHRPQEIWKNELLETLLSHQSHSVQGTAVDALSRLGTKPAITKLNTIIASHQELAEEAAIALLQILGLPATQHLPETLLNRPEISELIEILEEDD